jgi:general secretion pathway protein D
MSSHSYAKPWPYLWCISILLLSGCAAQMAYRDGRDLAERGQGAAALAKFEEAANLDKGGAQYRIAVLQTREALINAALVEGIQPSTSDTT